MSVTAIVLVAAFVGLAAISVPFAIAIGLATMAVVVVADIEPAFFAQQMVAGSQSFSLLAIPLFMLAGELMTAGGLSSRLVHAAGVLVRHRTGGLAMVTVIASAVFAAISGSAPATTAAMGSIMIPAMARAGYDKGFATALAVSSGVLGPLIPPSIAFVIWGVIAEQSIGRLFLSGVVPGLAIAAGLLVAGQLGDVPGQHPEVQRPLAAEGRVEGAAVDAQPADEVVDAGALVAVLGEEGRSAGDRLGLVEGPWPSHGRTVAVVDRTFKNERSAILAGDGPSGVLGSAHARGR
jgi:hypothetical protein